MLPLLLKAIVENKEIQTEIRAKQSLTDQCKMIALISQSFKERVRGEISIEVIGRRRHCKQLCEGMEIPSQLEFSCAKEVQMNCLKELLAKKIQV